MSIQEILAGGGGLIVVLMTLIQIAPIKVNPWSSLARAFGRAINGDILKELTEIKKTQKETRKTLDEHIEMDDERNADAHRNRILQFNNELLRDIRHTREDFIEILTEIDFYERYCAEHPRYQNNRAAFAVENIGRVYKERLQKRDFLGEEQKASGSDE